MARIKYVLDTFDSRRSANGELCLMIANPPSGSTDPSSIYNINTDGTAVSAFKGTGICKFVQPNSYLITIDGETFSFDGKGEPTSLNARGYHLKMAAVDKTITRAGTASPTNTTTSTTIPTTRSGEPVTVEEGYTDDSASNPKMPVDSLQPRDQFAIQALRSLLANVPNSATLSKNEIAYYCDTAYKYAAYMMRAAADARGSYDYEGDDSGDTRSTDTSTLSSNTEKLLNDIVNSLRRTDDVIPSSTGTWKKAGQTDVSGAYTDEVAATLGNYANIAAAEADGWSWTADSYDYHEKISIGGNSLGTAEHPFVVSTGSSGDDTVHIGNTSAGTYPGYGESTANPFNINGPSAGLIIKGNDTGGVLNVASGVTNGTTNFNVKTAQNEQVAVKGGQTHLVGETTVSDVLKVAVVAGGGGGSGGGFDGNILTMPSLTGTLGITNTSLDNIATSVGNYNPSAQDPVANAGSLIKVLYDIKQAISSGGGGGSITRNDATAWSDAAYGAISEILVFLNSNVGDGLYRVSPAAILNKLYSSFNAAPVLIPSGIEIVGYYNDSQSSSLTPYKLNSWQLASFLKPELDSRYSLEVEQSPTMPNVALGIGKYYYLGRSSGGVGGDITSISITLPTPSDVTVPSLIMANIKTGVPLGTSVPVSISSTNTIKWRGASVSSVDPNTEYEFDFVFAVDHWIVGVTKIVS